MVLARYPDDVELQLTDMWGQGSTMESVIPVRIMQLHYNAIQLDLFTSYCLEPVYGIWGFISRNPWMTSHRLSGTVTWSTDLANKPIKWLLKVIADELPSPSRCCSSLGGCLSCSFIALVLLMLLWQHLNAAVFIEKYQRLTKQAGEQSQACWPLQDELRWRTLATKYISLLTSSSFHWSRTSKSLHRRRTCPRDTFGLDLHTHQDRFCVF